MSISFQGVKNRYLGDGATTNFAFSFKVFSPDDVKVYFTEFDNITLVDPSEYLVVIEDTEGGEIQFLNDPPIDGQEIFLLSDTEVRQELELDNNSDLSLTQIENSLDRLTKYVLELNEKINRAAKAPIDFNNLEYVLPEPEAGKYLTWDGNLGRIRNSEGTVDPILADASGTNYDNSGSTLVAGNVEGAIDELDFKIESLDLGEDNTTSNSGTGLGLAQAKAGENLPFKSLLQRPDTSSNLGFFTSNTNDITINFPIALVSVTAIDELNAKLSADSLFTTGTPYGPITLNSSYAGRLKFYWTNRNIYYTWNGTDWISDLDPTLFLLGDIIKVGTVSNTSDSAQTFNFDLAFVNGSDSDISVVINRQVENSNLPLYATNITKSGFQINRTDSIDGTDVVNYIAINNFYL